MEQELKEGIEEQEFQDGIDNQEELGGAEQETAQADEAQRFQMEQKARESGWVPKNEFRGDNTKWRPADEWNRRAETFLPIARATNKKLEDKIAALEAKLATSEGTLERIAKTQDKFSGDFYDTELSEIKAAKLQAVEEGDVSRYRALEERETKLVKPESVQATPRKTAEPKPDSVHPDILQWQSENPWFKNDEVMQAYALFVGNKLYEANDPVIQPGKERAFCDKIKERIVEKFPDKFSNPNRQRTGIDESGLRGGEEFSSGNNSTKDWNHLPAAAKAACMKQITANPKITKAAWTKYYYEQEEA